MGHNQDDFLRFANRMIDEGHEGVIVKNPTSAYTMGKRGGGWWKWKPDYVDELTDTIDLLVVGAYFGCVGPASVGQGRGMAEGKACTNCIDGDFVGREGEKRSRGRVSHFLLAVADGGAAADSRSRPRHFKAFCKVSTPQGHAPACRRVGGWVSLGRDFLHLRLGRA
jgi:ATP-dependent DNA ligase